MCHNEDIVCFPRRGTANSAGLDLSSPTLHVIHPLSSCLIDTGIQFTFPHGYYGKLFDKSSRCHMFMINAGVIDSDYDGTIKVNVINFKNETLKIYPGMEICQIVFMPYAGANLFQRMEPSPTFKRVHSGFGSTSGGQVLFSRTIGRPLKNLAEEFDDPSLDTLMSPKDEL